MVRSFGEFLHVHPDITEAKAERRPVVALESTIIAHGMPFPQNVKTAIAVEEAVRSTGAVPATIAILDGRLMVGLTRAEIWRIGKRGGEVIKCSRRDIPIVVARSQHGATTVAATMIIAEMAGITVFATGGIGGVHRGASETMDISADLQELSRTNVAVVSAGIKAILDIGLTLEYLETAGVPVIGYKTDMFPAFYMRDSGFPVDARAESPEEIARIIDTKWRMGLNGGVLIANPIPAEYEMEYGHIQSAIRQSLDEANAQGITGKAVTPFLLERIGQLTDNASLESNIQLVLNNARLAGEIAVALKS